MFDYERNKQHERLLCNEIRELPNQTIKKLAVSIKSLVRKVYSLITHDYKNTMMTEILNDYSYISIAKNSRKKESITSFLNFKKLVDKLEQAEITMKLEETENMKLQNVNIIQSTTSQINHIHDSDTDLSEKITEILSIYE